MVPPATAACSDVCGRVAQQGRGHGAGRGQRGRGKGRPMARARQLPGGWSLWARAVRRWAPAARGCACAPHRVLDERGQGPVHQHGAWHLCDSPLGSLRPWGGAGRGRLGRAARAVARGVPRARAGPGRPPSGHPPRTRGLNGNRAPSTAPAPERGAGRGGGRGRIVPRRPGATNGGREGRPHGGCRHPGRPQAHQAPDGRVFASQAPRAAGHSWRARPSRGFERRGVVGGTINGVI
jgi:hypothetical protein